MRKTTKRSTSSATKRRPFSLDPFPDDLRGIVIAEGRKTFGVNVAVYIASILRGSTPELRAELYAKGIQHRASEVGS